MLRAGREEIGDSGAASDWLGPALPGHPVKRSLSQGRERARGPNLPCHAGSEPFLRIWQSLRIASLPADFSSAALSAAYAVMLVSQAGKS
jgi:hypothetical protein